MRKSNHEMIQDVEQTEDELSMEIEAVKARAGRLAKKLNKYIQSNGSSQKLKDRCKNMLEGEKEEGSK